MEYIRKLENLAGYDVWLVKNEKKPLLVAAAAKKAGIIVVTDFFFSLFTKEEQRSVLYHEIGHLRLHKDRITSKENYLEKEKEADLYAAQRTNYSDVLAVIEAGIRFFQTLYQANKITKQRYDEAVYNLKERFGYIANTFIFCDC